MISALTPEAKSPVAQRWLADNLARGLAVSPWVDTEFSVAIAMKCRIGDLDADGQMKVTSQWRSWQRRLHDEPVRQRHFRPAAALVALPDIDLRGDDALHLAIVRDHAFDLATLMREFGTAAQGLSVTTIDPLTT